MLSFILAKFIWIFFKKLNDNINKNNIIYYNDSLNEKVNESFDMIDSLKNKTFGQLFEKKMNFQ